MTPLTTYLTRAIRRVGGLRRYARSLGLHHSAIQRGLGGAPPETLLAAIGWERCYRPRVNGRLSRKER